ncbi:MAG: signal peptidase II [Caldilineaceae bacterium]|nr:signal peptidase II [Caldilineaceae bacterium]MCB0141428.1 signal peptidase II [Caldilineaceae bacterium]MCB9155990.1 signal peptidase II [Caldilineaceae bacterium]
MNKLSRILILLFVIFTCVGCDQATKRVAETHLRTSAPISYLNNTVRLEYAENPGAFLSLGAGLSEDAQHWIFTIMVTLILGGFLLFAFLYLHNLRLATLIALALYIGGGLGNLIDRLFNNGVVVDFMNVGVGSLRTGIFNVADMAIMAAVAILLITQFPKQFSTQKIEH